MDSNVVDARWRKVPGKDAVRADGVTYLAGNIKSGGPAFEGALPLPRQALAEADAQAIAQWLAHAAKK